MKISLRSRHEFVEANQVTDEPVELLDIFPTLADLAGLPVPPPCTTDDIRARTELCTQGKSVKIGSIPKDSVAVSQYPRSSTNPLHISPAPKLNTIRYMGYTARYRHFRYTMWVKFDNVAVKPEMGRLIADELYDYDIDPDGNFNAVKNESYALKIDFLRREIKSRILF